MDLCIEILNIDFKSHYTEKRESSRPNFTKMEKAIFLDPKEIIEALS
jgi:hypothetical protein